MAVREGLTCLPPTITTTIFTLLSAFFFATIVVRSLYRLSPFHPLAHIPGPILPRLSSLWLIYHSWAGDEASAVHALHQRYGSIVCIGPNAADIADGAALHAIYVEKGGFRKPSFYNNFSVDGHKTIFAEDEPKNRAPRAKAVLPAFSTASLRERGHLVVECAREWTAVLQMYAASGRTVDVLGLARSFAADSVCVYLFGVPFGALETSRAVAEARVRKHADSGSDSDPDSDGGHFRDDGCVDFFDGFGRYWYLSPWIFSVVEWFRLWLFSSEALFATFDILDAFADKAVNASVSSKQDLAGTFQARLLNAGFSPSETKAQCKDALYAGIETTGLNLATTVFYLTKHPDKYAALKREIAERRPTDEQVQSLPYLHAVVQEGLRISMANPTRFPRVVPAGGWRFHDVFFPADTEVSCSSFELHSNAHVFAAPREFRPERWLQPSEEMLRDLIPFGAGSRRCIAMNLAAMELRCAVFQLARDDVLAGAKCCEDKIEFWEWFSIKVVGGKIGLSWE